MTKATYRGKGSLGLKVSVCVCLTTVAGERGSRQAGASLEQELSAYSLRHEMRQRDLTGDGVGF